MTSAHCAPDRHSKGALANRQREWCANSNDKGERIALDKTLASRRQLGGTARSQQLEPSRAIRCPQAQNKPALQNPFQGNSRPLPQPVNLPSECEWAPGEPPVQPGQSSGDMVKPERTPSPCPSDEAVTPPKSDTVLEEPLKTEPRRAPLQPSPRRTLSRPPPHPPQPDLETKRSNKRCSGKGRCTPSQRSREARGR